MADQEPSGYAGIKLRGGLPSDNGLAPLADELVNDKTRIVYFVAAAKVADIVEHVDNGTKTSVLKLSSGSRVTSSIRRSRRCG